MDYATLKERVEDEINRTDLSTNIATWINEARCEIADGTLPVPASKSQGAYRFSWSYENTVVSTSTATNAWPTDMIEEISMLFVAEEKPLQKIMPQYFDELLYSETDNQYDLGQTGNPKVYIPRGANYELFPDPSGADVELYLRYYEYPTDLTAAADEEEIDKRCYSLIIMLCAYKAFKYLHDTARAKEYRDYVGDYYTAVVNRDRMKKFANRKLRMKSVGDYDIGHWKGMFQIGSIT